MSKHNIFWIGYSDLMTTLFFVILVIFVLTSGFLVTSMSDCDEKIASIQDSLNLYKDSLAVSEQEKEKIKEITEALKNIDPEYFVYNEEHKKHVLDIGNDNFATGKSNIYGLKLETRVRLSRAGNRLKETMRKLQSDNIQYLIIIEGQASKDDWKGNDSLSFERALALRDFWFGEEIKSGRKINDILPNCEIIIAGSGQYGVPRDTPDIRPANQRFLVTIMPKIGSIDLDLN